jgi:hypothetical protein
MIEFESFILLDLPSGDEFVLVYPRAWYTQMLVIEARQEGGPLKLTTQDRRRARRSRAQCKQNVLTAQFPSRSLCTALTLPFSHPFKNTNDGGFLWR